LVIICTSFFSLLLVVVVSDSAVDSLERPVSELMHDMSREKLNVTQSASVYVITVATLYVVK